VYSGLSNKSNEEVKQWIKNHVEPPGKLRPTIDEENIVHIDWSSFYPVLAKKMQIYLTKEGYDRYSNMVTRRLEGVKPERAKLKKILAEQRDSLSDKEIQEYEHQIDLLNKEDAGSKFILNNATGGGNTKKSYALRSEERRVGKECRCWW